MPDQTVPGLDRFLANIALERLLTGPTAERANRTEQAERRCAELESELATIRACHGPCEPLSPPDLTLEQTTVRTIFGSEHRHTCPGDPECEACSVRDCPYGDALHYDDDGCPSCDATGSVDAEPTPGVEDPF